MKQMTLKIRGGSSLVVQWVKDLALSLWGVRRCSQGHSGGGVGLQGFDPWPGNFHILWCGQKKRKKKKKRKIMGAVRKKSCS